ncbi:hypothetical protein JCM16303_005108 [Sporobolomyces ruberrimus]
MTDSSDPKSNEPRESTDKNGTGSSVSPHLSAHHACTLSLLTRHVTVRGKVDERPRQHKRTRAAMDPGTPKGEEGEPKGLTSSTPVAKQRRVQDEPTPREGEGSPPSDSENNGRTTPPSSTTTVDTTLPPATPATTTQGSREPPTTEGKETKHIRERVAAMKASSSSRRGQSVVNESSDTELVSPVGREDETGKGTGEQDKEMKAAETAAEVSVTAERLGNEEEEKLDEDTEIAEVAAEVSKSAEMVNGTASKEGLEKGELTGEAKIADEVSRDAAKLEKEDEVIADTAAETAQVAQDVPETTKSAAKATTFVPYTGGGSSSFSAFSSTSSPFTSVSTPAKPTAPPAPPVESQKPKTKSSFSASPFLSSSIPPAKKPDSSTPAPIPSSFSSSIASSSSSLAPSTPASKPLSSNSPFSAFASTSGFAASAKKSALGSSNAFGTPSSAFSSYSAAPSAFASVPSTPSSKSPLPPSTNSTAAGATSTGEDSSTPPTTVTPETSETPLGGDTGRKIGEPELVDENKRIYTERETRTGEEGDKVVHNVRAKLYAMQDENWVERGTGPLKVNLTKREGEKDGARIVMRADATHRLLLNSPLFKEFFIEVSNEKYVRFTIIEGSEPISYMARLGNPAAAEALVTAIRERTSAL